MAYRAFYYLERRWDTAKCARRATAHAILTPAAAATAPVPLRAKHRAGGSLFHRHRTYLLFANLEVPTRKYSSVLAVSKSANTQNLRTGKQACWQLAVSKSAKTQNLRTQIKGKPF